MRFGVLGEVATVSVFLNGLRKSNFQGKDLKVEVEIVVALQPGENILAVFASHEFASSKPETRKIRYVPAPGPTSPARLAANSRNDTRSSCGGTANYQPSVQFLKSSYSKPELTVAPEKGNVVPLPPINFALIEPGTDTAPTDNENLPIKAVAFAEKELKLQVLLNGRSVFNGPIDHNGAVYDGNFTLDKPGKNTVVVTVTNGVDTTAPITRTIFYNPRVAKKPSLVFLGIGISQYESFNPTLDYADSDAREVAKLFYAQSGDNQLFDQVCFKVITNEEATRERILDELDWLNKTAKYDNDIRVLMLSGHGGRGRNGHYYFYSKKQKQKDGQPENEDRDSISWHNIWSSLTSKNGTVLLFIDTCYSGAIDPRDLFDPNQLGRVAFFGSARENQKSLELETFHHGAFTQALIEGLNGKAETGDNDTEPRDGKITVDELNTWLKTRVSRLTSEKQLPLFLPNPLLPIVDVSKFPITIPANPPPNCPLQGSNP
jgi:Caspase domain